MGKSLKQHPSNAGTPIFAEVTFCVVARYTVRKAEITTVIENLQRLSQATKLEPGNLEYHFFQNLEESSEILVFERYTDGAAFKAHRESGHFQRFAIQEVIPRLLSRSVETFTAPPSA
ncbi:antibiotic biosynthesis monooxygenase family protein [Arthrobacter sp. MYb227]|uniref:antibiotic biosynthesis monooxygenase family protein n=1 Tax=Arthrobacter sp. MYb227 TaxID=1848601 RepID=UPI0015E455AD